MNLWLREYFVCVVKGTVRDRKTENQPKMEEGWLFLLGIMQLPLDRYAV